MHLHRRTARGFTLVELLIVIGIMAVLAAIAVTGYLKYIHNAQSSEARMVMDQIRAGEEAYRVETLKYLSCSPSLTAYYPNKTPNDDSRWAWVRPGDAAYTGCWVMLDVHPDAPVRYGYAVTADIAPTMPPPLDPDFTNPPTLTKSLVSGTPWFVAAARNKHVASMLPSLLVTTSFDGTIYSEGDGN